jgi:uncharacterized protein
MSDYLSRPCTAFDGSRRLAFGPLIEVVLAVKAASAEAAGPIFVFDDATGRVMDFDLRGAVADVVDRLTRPSPARRAPPEEPAGEPRGRGRPKLGVIGREVTLLPRHWEWLATQPGGASVALRKLVDEARRSGGAKQKMREAHERAYQFMSAMAGNLPGFEEASRALFANDRVRFDVQTAGWPADVRAYATRLAFEGTL